MACQDFPCKHVRRTVGFSKKESWISGCAAEVIEVRTNRSRPGHLMTEDCLRVLTHELLCVYLVVLVFRILSLVVAKSKSHVLLFTSVFFKSKTRHRLVEESNWSVLTQWIQRLFKKSSYHGIYLPWISRMMVYLSSAEEVLYIYIYFKKNTSGGIFFFFFRC